MITEFKLFESNLLKLELKNVYSDVVDIFKSNFYSLDDVNSWQLSSDIGNKYITIYFQNTVDWEKFEGSLTRKKIREVCKDAMNQVYEEYPGIFDTEKSNFYLDKTVGHASGGENEEYVEILIELIPFPHIKAGEDHGLL